MSEILRLPDGKPIRTGPVQFGDDWPGIFIRGDEADGMAHILRNFHKLPPGAQKIQIAEWCELLTSCHDDAMARSCRRSSGGPE